MLWLSRTAIAATCGINQQLWSMVLGESTLRLDRICFSDTSRDQTMDQLWWTTLMYYTTVFLLVTLVDFVAVRPVTFAFLKLAGKPTSHLRRTSWLLLHATFNTFITVISIEEAFLCFLNPTSNVYDPPRWWGVHSGSLLGAIAIGAFHLQHFAFYEFTTEDVVHHLLNAGVVVLIGALCPWGRLTSVSNIVMCGVPGGVNYFALWLRKGGVLRDKTQKQINRAMNILLRYPVQLLSAYIFTISVLSGRFPAVSWPVWLAMVFGVVAHTGNSLYYADQVVGNYWLFTTKEKRAD